MSIKYQKLKIVVLCMWSDVHRSCIWWITIQIGARWYSFYSELQETAVFRTSVGLLIYFIFLKIIRNMEHVKR